MTAPPRADALALLNEYVHDPKLRIHALCVEGVMRYQARKHQEDEDLWGIVGLLHDIDYERYPNEHCTRTRDILAPRGYAEEVIRAAESHGWGICSTVEPLTRLERSLYAFDELTGLVYATALVRPSRSVHDTTVKSIRKKWNVRSFAAGANRDVIDAGAQMLGCSRDDLLADCLAGMQSVADAIGLAGESHA